MEARALPKSAVVSALKNPVQAVTASVRVPVRGKLLHKLLVVLLSLSVIPLILTGYQVIRVSRAYIEQEEIGKVQVGIAQRVSGNVSSYMENVRNILQVIHKSSDFLTMNPQRQTQILENVMNAYPMFMRLSVLSLKGQEVAAVNRLGDGSGLLSPSSYQEVLKRAQTEGEYLSPVTRSPERYPLLTIGVPIERIPGRPLGVLVGVVNLMDLSSLVEDLKVGKKGYIYVVDSEQNLIAHPNRAEVYSDTTPSEVTAAGLAPIDRRYGAIEFADQKNQQFFAAYATIPKLNWRVFVQQPIEEAFESSTQMRRQITKTLVGVILVTLVLAGIMSQTLVNRVKTLQAAMEQVGEGNFDIPQVPISNDEFGSLSEKFIWMARSLKDKTLRLVSAQRELQKWNTELERRVQERTRALQEAQEQLIAQEKLAALGQMASVVGHELRNPLAVMNNSIYFLKSKLTTAAEGGAMDPKLEKHLHILEGEVVKSNTIIRDILDFARNRALNASPQKVDELVEKAIERIQFPPNVSLSKSMGLNGTEAMVDEDELRQVLVNLMENACQAMTSGGTLTVGTKAQGDQVQIDISDTGCGIPQEHLNKIFAPFFTTKSRGTGLGLAVVKKVIDRHNGSIDVESKVGEGTAFHIRLPIKIASVTGG